MILCPTPPSAPARLAACLPAAALVALAVPLAAQGAPGSFQLPPASPAPTPAPTSPADERGGVAIPPRTAASPLPTPSPTARPVVPPSVGTPVDAVILPPPEFAPPRTGTGAPSSRPTSPSAASTPAITPEAPPLPGGALPAASGAAPPLARAPAGTGGAEPAPEIAFPPRALPEWWPLAAGGLGALALLGGGALVWRRRKARPLRLAAPAAGAARDGAGEDAPATDLPRLDLTLEITAATRSMMMFTLEYRLTIANRSERAVNDLSLALQLACARASGAGNAPSAGRAQALQNVPRIGPHQARSITGTVQLPLAAIAPLRQGATPLFVPLVHVTLEGEGQRALTRSFVVGTPSASGRVHPIPLDVPPGTLAGLVAQAIALPPAASAAA